jgi:hypothetical protein
VRGDDPVRQRGPDGRLDDVDDVDAGGQALVQRCCSRTRSTRSATLISTYSASTRPPVGAAPTQLIFGWGEKPALYAIGTCARRSARSKARAMSRWLVKRSRPRLV